MINRERLLYLLFIFILLLNKTDTKEKSYLSTNKANFIEDDDIVSDLILEKDELILRSSLDGNISAYGINDLDPKWQISLGKPLISSYFNKNSLISSNVNVFPGLNWELLYSDPEKNHFSKLNLNLKTLILNSPFSLPEFPDYLFIGNKVTNIYLVDLTYGVIISSIIDGEEDIFRTKPLHSNNLITIIRINYTLKCVDEKTGSVIWVSNNSEVLINEKSGKQEINLGNIDQKLKKSTESNDDNRNLYSLRPENKNKTNKHTYKDIVSVHRIRNGVPIKIYDFTKTENKSYENYVDHYVNPTYDYKKNLLDVAKGFFEWKKQKIEFTSSQNQNHSNYDKETINDLHFDNDNFWKFLAIFLLTILTIIISILISKEMKKNKKVQMKPSILKNSPQKLVIPTNLDDSITDNLNCEKTTEVEKSEKVNDNLGVKAKFTIQTGTRRSKKISTHIQSMENQDILISDDISSAGDKKKNNLRKIMNSPNKSPKKRFRQASMDINDLISKVKRYKEDEKFHQSDNDSQRPLTSRENENKEIINLKSKNLNNDGNDSGNESDVNFVLCGLENDTQSRSKVIQTSDLNLIEVEPQSQYKGVYLSTINSVDSAMPTPKEINKINHIYEGKKKEKIDSTIELFKKMSSDIVDIKDEDYQTNSINCDKDENQQIKTGILITNEENSSRNELTLTENYSHHSNYNSRLLFRSSRKSLIDISRRNTKNLINKIEELDNSHSSYSIQPKFSKMIASNMSLLDNGRFKKDFLISDFLGEGGFGQVSKGKHKLDGSYYAIKIINLKVNFNNDLKDLPVMIEVKTMLKLLHRNVVRYFNCWFEMNEEEISKNFGSKKQKDSVIITKSLNSNRSDNDGGIEFQVEEKTHEQPVEIISSSSENEEKAKSISYEKNTENSEKKNLSFNEDLLTRNTKTCKDKVQIQFYIQMEYCGDSTLHNYLDRGKSLDRRTIIYLFKQIVDGVCHLHRNKVIHRDLKPANIFLLGTEKSRPLLKIGDFGLAADFKERKEQTGFSENVGTPLYQSPEQFKNLLYDEKVDIYAMGLILLEMCMGFKTYHERKMCLEKMREEQKTIPEKIRNEFPLEEKLIVKMTNYKPSQRPKALEIIKSQEFLELQKYI